MDMNKNVVKIVATIVLIVIALISIFGVSNKVSSPEFHKKSIKLLDNKKMTVASMTGAAAAASTAISAIPGDATTPIANEIMDMASYLLIITGVIFLEKLLLTLTGMITFKFLIPIACCLGIIYLYWKKDTLKNLAIKLSVFGILIFIVVPLSTYVSSWLENNYKDTIALSVEEVENIDFEEKNEEKTNSEGFINGLKNKAQDVTENITSGVSSGIEKAKEVLSKFIDAIAVLIITTCVIPIAVMIFLIWIIKMIFGINIPVKNIVKKKGNSKEDTEGLKIEE